MITARNTAEAGSGARTEPSPVWLVPVALGALCTVGGVLASMMPLAAVGIVAMVVGLAGVVVTRTRPTRTRTTKTARVKAPSPAKAEEVVEKSTKAEKAQRRAKPDATTPRKTGPVAPLPGVPVVDLPSGPAKGWFKDPKDSSQLRWWDGSSWTKHTRPRPEKS